ncbi:1,4-alpha-glucan branching protein GlgB [Janibacter limosus]|uniref:1,4-alpha-glucan branching protein GlgB n=1 Tax=Janibacter limosus TaxID=53458 RepID=UPI0035DBC9F0|nr:1,4-alpha-glucan branching protein GlgB [Janibacter limosus]
MNPTPDPALTSALWALAHGRHAQPHDLLGQHLEEAGLRVRVRRPLATRVTVRFEDGVHLDLEHEGEGIFSGVRAGCTRTMDYRVVTTREDGVEHPGDDAYRFAPTVGEVDQHLINEGRHEQLWTVLGAHTHSYDGPMGGVDGVSFAVWAPRAKAVHVIGDFNGWDGSAHPMRALGASGVWEVFVPGAGVGDVYKFAVRGADDVVRHKADPPARLAETAPATGSVVTSSSHVWQDGAWLEQRAASDPHTSLMSIYEVHPGSWRQGLGWRDPATELVDHVVRHGFTHVELMPVMDHPYPPSWGYHVTSYFAPNSRFGSPDDFRHLVDAFHRAGVGVLLDWVPGHFATDEWALVRFDGLPLYEHPDPRRGWQPDWGSHVFDFGRPEVRNFLVANALYWLEDFHIDGLRVDGVASMLYPDYSREPGEWIPNVHGGRENLEAVALLREVNATAYRRLPGIVTVAEESTARPGVTRPTDEGGLGFGLKWNMGWMNDVLRYLGEDPVNREHHHTLLSFAMMYAYAENYLLPISHDEVVHGKGSMPYKVPGGDDERFATLRAFFAYQWAFPGKQLIFMGTEFGQTSEWADGRSLDWHLLDHAVHRRTGELVAELNSFARSHRAMWALDADPAGFRWLDADDNHGNTVAFLRLAEQGDDVVAVVVNFGGTARSPLRIGVAEGGRWEVRLDTSGYDAAGSPSRAGLVLDAEPHARQDQPWSVEVHVAALSAVYLTPASA